MRRELRKRQMKLTVIYFAVVTVICIIAHFLAFSAAKSFRGYNGLGSEIFIVPCILLLSYILYKKVIKMYFKEQMNELRSAYFTVKNSKCTCVIYLFNKKLEPYGKYSKGENGKVVFEHIN